MKKNFTINSTDLIFSQLWGMVKCCPPTKTSLPDSVHFQGTPIQPRCPLQVLFSFWVCVFYFFQMPFLPGMLKNIFTFSFRFILPMKPTGQLFQHQRLLSVKFRFFEQLIFWVPSLCMKHIHCTPTWCIKCVLSSLGKCAHNARGQFFGCENCFVHPPKIRGWLVQVFTQISQASKLSCFSVWKADLQVFFPLLDALRVKPSSCILCIILTHVSGIETMSAPWPLEWGSFKMSRLKFHTRSLSFQNINVTRNSGTFLQNTNYDPELCDCKGGDSSIYQGFQTTVCFYFQCVELRVFGASDYDLTFICTNGGLTGENVHASAERMDRVSGTKNDRWPKQRHTQARRTANERLRWQAIHAGEKGSRATEVAGSNNGADKWKQNGMDEWESWEWNVTHL